MLGTAAFLPGSIPSSSTTAALSWVHSRHPHKTTAYLPGSISAINTTTAYTLGLFPAILTTASYLPGSIPATITIPTLSGRRDSSIPLNNSLSSGFDSPPSTQQKVRYFFSSGVDFPLYLQIFYFTVQHNDPAAHQDHWGRCRIRTRDPQKSFESPHLQKQH